MKINELSDNMRKIDVEGTITKLFEPRDVNLKAGGRAKVLDTILEDETGSIKLSLWNEDIDRVQENVKVKIENGYTNSFRGEIRLNIGRYGKLTVENE